VSTVTVYVATGCHLCETAVAELERLRAELGFELVEVDIGGRAELERAYRPWIPVVELAGERLSVFQLDEPLLRARLAGEAGLEPPY
jgi:glutaredoxin